jgi:hypothetical protein
LETRWWNIFEHIEKVWGKIYENGYNCKSPIEKLHLDNWEKTSNEETLEKLEFSHQTISEISITLSEQ